MKVVKVFKKVEQNFLPTEGRENSLSAHFYNLLIFAQLFAQLFAH